MPYLIHIAIFIGITAILGISLNLVVGYAGLLSLAQAAFYGIGAYATAILTTRFEFNFFTSLLIGILLAMFASLLFGLVMSRFRGDYFALASFGFNIIIWSIFTNWQSLTRGSLGIPGIPRPELFGFIFQDNHWFLALVIGFVLLVLGIAALITRSTFGRTLQAIREDEDAVKTFGYRTASYKLLVFVLAAGLASIAGSLFASYIAFIDPSSFALMESVSILSAIILGGLASHVGAILGVVVLNLLPEALRFVGLPSNIAAEMRQVIYGSLLTVLMIYRPRGLLGSHKL